MNVLIIFNPVSGLKHIRARRKDLESLLREEKVEDDWIETTPKGVPPLKEHLKKPYDRIIVIGGDGTVREVVQCLLESTQEISIGIVPQGSANILAGSLGIPLLQPKRALMLALKGDPRPLDVMEINRKHYALIGASQGYDAVFIRGATRTLKAHIGPLAYALSFLKTFFWYRNHAYRLTVDSERHFVTGKVVMVLNTLSLGGIHLDSRISPHDGLLNVVVLRPRNIWEILFTAACVLLRCPLRSIPTIQTFAGRSVTVQQKGGRSIHMDGDIVRGKQLKIDVLPGAIKVALSHGGAETESSKRRRAPQTSHEHSCWTCLSDG